jgi:hypothetical protein
MSKALEARIEQLERDAGMAAEQGVKAIIRTFIDAKDGKPVPQGALTGYTVNGQQIERPPSESEEAFTERIVAEAQLPWPNIASIAEHRTNASEH